MPVPTRYVQGYSYSGWQAGNPKKPLPAAEIDNELANLQLTTDEIIDALGDVRRSDGKLQTGSVDADSLDRDFAAQVLTTLSAFTKKASTDGARALHDALPKGSTWLDDTVSPMIYYQRITDVAGTWDGPLRWAVSDAQIAATPLAKDFATQSISVRKHLSLELTTQDFAIDRLGITNTTLALKAFYDACIDNKVNGYILPGTYIITPGVLSFDNAWVDKILPYFRTDGPDAVIFKRADATDAPLLSFSNGVALSGAGKYWREGGHGGVKFDQNGKATASNQNGLSLRGMWGSRFGHMRGDDLGGSTVHMPQQLFAGNNPDPYANTFCEFENIEGNRNKVRAFDNQNFVGFNGCRVKNLRAISCENGAFYGFGAANEVGIASVGSCKGVAFDDGCFTSNLGGSPTRFVLGMAELDDVQYAFRLNKTVNSDLGIVRIIPRRNFSALNPGEGYWPRTGISLAGGTAPAVSSIKGDVIWRIEAGGVKAELGTFVAFHNVASTDITLNHKVLDNAGFGIADSDLYANRSGSGTQLMMRDGKTVLDDRVKPHVIARGSVAGTAMTIGADPFLSTNGSTTVRVNMPAHGLVQYQSFTLQGATAFNGITANELNRSHFVTTVVDADNVEVVVESAANASSNGGGAGVTAAKNRSFMNIAGAFTAKCKLALPTEVSDRAALFDPNAYEYTMPYDGFLHVRAAIGWTGFSAGVRVRMYALGNVHTAAAILGTAEMRCQGVNRETLTLDKVFFLTRGTKVCIGCDSGHTAPAAMNVVATQDIDASFVLLS